VHVRAVGAVEVADVPAVLAVTDLGVPAAHRTIVEHDFQRREPARAQQRPRFPGPALHLVADPAQADHPLHDSLPNSARWATGGIVTVPSILIHVPGARAKSECYTTDNPTY